MSSKRIQKTAQLLKEEISRILREEIQNPNLGFVTVTYVDVSKDLKHAFVRISVFGDSRKQQESMKIIKKAVGFIKNNIGKSLPIKYVPDLKFELDKSAEYSVYIDKKIDELNKINDE